MKTFEKLTQVEVTQGSNGYPKGIYKAYISDSIAELQEVQRNEGGEIIILKKRDGWHLYQSEGRTFYDSFIDAPQSEQDYSLVANAKNVEKVAFNFVVGNFDGISEYLAVTLPGETDCNKIISFVENIQQQFVNIISEVGDSEDDVLLNFGPNMDDFNYSVARDSANYHDDVWTYQYALIKED